MARYELQAKPSVAKDLQGLPRAQVWRLLSQIKALRTDPRARGCEILSAGEGLYRVRQGAYRIVYAVLDERAVIEILSIARRVRAHRG